MKLLIAGSRHITPAVRDLDEAYARLLQHPRLAPDLKTGVQRVLSGRAMGVDQAGEGWAHVRVCGALCPRRAWERESSVYRRQHPIPLCEGVTPMPVTPDEWNRLGNAAGPRRNERMAIACDAAIVVWDGKTPGTRSMIRFLEREDKPTELVIWGQLSW